MNAARVFALKMFRDVGKELRVDVIGEERCERCEASAKGEDDFEEGVEGM